MRVLLIQQFQPEVNRKRPRHPLFPIGLSYIATALAGHEVRIFDPNAPNAYDAPYESLRDAVVAFRPDVVGISIRNIDTVQRRHPLVYFKTVRPTVEVVKSVGSAIRVIAGGAGFSMFAAQIMERVPGIDYGVYLEGEESTPELLSNLDRPEAVKGIFFRRNGKVVFTGERPMPRFSDLPMPRRDPGVIDIEGYAGPFTYTMGIQAKRGCALNCAYCTYTFLNGRKMRLRDPAAIADEIAHLGERYGIRRFTFVDNIFNVPQEHARSICREIIRRKLDVEWEAWLSLGNFSEDFLRLLRDAGCAHVGFSPDAATDKGLVSLKKGITEKDIERSLGIVRRVGGVSASYNFFCCYPGQDMRGLLKTLLLMFKVPVMLRGRGGMGLGWIRIEPDTHMHQVAVKEGVIAEDADLLPEDEDAMSRLFYAPRSQRHITMTMDTVLAGMENVFEPGYRWLRRAMRRPRKHKEAFA